MDSTWTRNWEGGRDTGLTVNLHLPPTQERRRATEQATKEAEKAKEEAVAAARREAAEAAAAEKAVAVEAARQEALEEVRAFTEPFRHAHVAQSRWHAVGLAHT